MCLSWSCGDRAPERAPGPAGWSDLDLVHGDLVQGYHGKVLLLEGLLRERLGLPEVRGPDHVVGLHLASLEGVGGFHPEGLLVGLQHVVSSGFGASPRSLMT